MCQLGTGRQGAFVFVAGVVCAGWRGIVGQKPRSKIGVESDLRFGSFQAQQAQYEGDYKPTDAR
jgi:hypothetical protein